MKRKSGIFIHLFVITGIFLMLTSSCSKHDDTNNPIQSGPTKDGDGNEYRTVTIGTQVWLAENLKVTKLSNGTGLQNVTDDTSWRILTTPGYCWYNNDVSNKNIYGALYNWYTVSTGKLCPTGWHVPSQDEWTTLINYLGGELNAKSKLLETGTAHWQSGNPEITNASGFTALPGGIRFNSGSFANLGVLGEWWSSTSVNGNNAWSLSFMDIVGTGVITMDGSKVPGYSVRCLKN